jgi:hypothetical protein
MAVRMAVHEHHRIVQEGPGADEGTLLRQGGFPSSREGIAERPAGMPEIHVGHPGSDGP